MSASQMIGTRIASAIYRALVTISGLVSSPTSGKPRSAAVPVPAIWTAGQSTASPILACMALRINGATIIGPACNICRHLVVNLIGVHCHHEVDAHTQGENDEDPIQ